MSVWPYFRMTFDWIGISPNLVVSSVIDTSSLSLAAAFSQGNSLLLVVGMMCPIYLDQDGVWYHPPRAYVLHDLHALFCLSLSLVFDDGLNYKP